MADLTIDFSKCEFEEKISYESSENVCNKLFESSGKKRLRELSPSITDFKKSKVEINHDNKENGFQNKDNLTNELFIEKSIRKIPNKDFISMTNSKGNKFFFQFKDNRHFEDKFKNVLKEKYIDLLSSPLTNLKYHIQQEILKKNKEKICKINYNELIISDQNLWVNKYSPCKYQDLISEEMANRNLLRWLKQWDYCVFNKKVPKNFLLSKNKISGTNDKKEFNASLHEELDMFNRPYFKIALVSGPPGLGKTTLAHIVANHAGYNVVEMNASDDRTLEVFKNKIENATQMKSVISNNPKPNCLIIDEIDGSQQIAINALITLINGKDNAINKKKKEKNILLRPIICICNDLYVPALRPLKQIAYLVYFNAFTSSKLASRLLAISQKESIKTDLTCLMALCEKTGNDIRSCVNTLQFVKSDKSELNLKMIESMHLGQKDSHKTLFQIWHSIFTLPKPDQKKQINSEVKKDTNTKKLLSFNRFMNILTLVSTIGEDSKIMQGLFENYLVTKAKDTRLEMMNEASHWFCFNDILNWDINNQQNFTLLRYLPFLSIALHFMFATNNSLKIKYPQTEYEIQMGILKSKNILTSMYSNICPSVNSMCNQSIMAMQIIPYLISIIQPNIRPVNMQLFSMKEKIEIMNVVKIMRLYNLTYLLEKNPDGQFSFNLDPNIDLISNLSIEKASRIAISYTNKQMIAREIELDRVRKSEKESDNLSPNTILDNEKGKNYTNHLNQNLVPKVIVIKDNPKQVKDFFGRNLQLGQLESASNESSASGGIYFHYKEGFTNAVRRTVRIKDFK